MRVGFGWFAAALVSFWVLRAHVSPDFTPIRSELTNARGFSRGVLNLVVLPAGEPFGRMPASSFVVCGALFLLLGAVRLTAFPPTPLFELRRGRAEAERRRKPSATYSSNARLSNVLRLMALAAMGLLLAVVLSPYLTPYRVVLAPRSFALLLVLVCATQTLSAWSLLAAKWRPVEAVRRRLLIGLTGALGAAFFASAMLQTLASYDGNYSGFLHLSREVAERAPFLQERPDLRQSLIVYDAGYDGQFMYLMAFDPLLQRFKDRPSEYRAVVDTPPYRYGRVGFSLLTHVAAGGHPERYPAAMMWLIVTAHFALAALLASVATRHGLSPLAGLWYLAIPGFTTSLVSALPEALSAAGIVAGYICWERRRPVLAAVSFGAALLVRETGIILVIALLLASARGDWRRSILVLGAALLPVCTWRLFVAGTFFSDFGWAALFPSSRNLGLPFAGVLELWQDVATGASSAGSVPAVAYPLILTAAAALAAWLFRIRRGGIELAALAYGIMAICLDYVNHLPSVERTTFELFICLLLISLETTGRPVWIRRSLTGLFAVLLVYTFLIAPDAPTSRAALLLIR